MLIAIKPRRVLAAGVLAALMPVQAASAAIAEAGDFAGHAIASSDELAAMRGGFEINIGGQLLSLAFSLERVSYLNGELLASTRIVVPDIAAAIVSPQTVSVETYVAPAAAGNAVVAQPQIAAPAAIASAAEQAISSRVTLIQNGVGGGVTLPAEASQQVNQALQAAQAHVVLASNHATIIQNALDNQVIRNLTTLNITLSNEMLARAVELNAALQSLLNGPIVVRP